MNIHKEVTEHIIQEFASDIDYAEMDPDLDILDSGIVDSLGLVRLVSWISERYGLFIDEAELKPDDFRTINAICEFVDSHSAATIRD